MNRTRSTLVLSILMATGFSFLFFSSCRRKSADGMIIFTQVYGKGQDKNVAEETLEYTAKTRIFSIDPDKSGDSPTILTEDFYSAKSPAVSFNGTQLIFTGQKKQGDTWQIYEMNPANSKINQITSAPENCIDPAWLPGERLIYSKIPLNDTLKSGHSIFSCNLNGSDVRQITFNPDLFSSSTILKDGRILTISKQVYPEKKDAVFMALRPDGTKAELFYKSAEGNILSGHGWETSNGRIVFIESDKSNTERGNVISIKYSRPLHTRVNLSSEIEGNFNSVFPLKSGRLLVSYRKSETDRYAIYGFDPEKRSVDNAIYSNKDFDILEVIAVETHERPKKLPSEVDKGVKTGLILCQNINVSEAQSSVNTSALAKAYKIQVIGKDSTLGVVQVEQDGSFYLKVIADTPFRIQTVDDFGKVLNGPGGWIWLRPNERRGCVGCHEDPEMVPGNNVPLSVKKAPVIIPVHKSNLKEKAIELE